MLSLLAWTTFKLFIQVIQDGIKDIIPEVIFVHFLAPTFPPWADSRRYSPSAKLPLWAFSQPPQLPHCFADSTVCCQRSFKTWFSPLKSPTGHGLCPQALQGRHTASPETFLNIASIPKRHRAWLDLLLPQISAVLSIHLMHSQSVHEIFVGTVATDITLSVYNLVVSGAVYISCLVLQLRLINHASWDIFVASFCTFQGAPPLTPDFQTFPAPSYAWPMLLRSSVTAL